MKKYKLGFTIVELVIVIAVIAILSAVLIPTFSGVIAKANLSADIQNGKNMNAILATDGAISGDATNIIEAQNYLKTNGYQKVYTPKSEDCHYYWYEGNNTVYLAYDKNDSFEIKFPEDDKEAIETAHTSNANAFYRLDEEFGSQYKYEINQLAEYMNMDSNKLESLLLQWVRNTSNRNKSYTELISGIETKEDALLVTTLYILGTEHFLVQDSDVLQIKPADFAKAVLNSDVIFKNTGRLFLCIDSNEISDEVFVNTLKSHILSTWNDEFLRIAGLDSSSGMPVSGIYDALKYSIDHSGEESEEINTYNLTANAIYKMLSRDCPDAGLGLEDIKASMNRMIDKSKAGTVLDSEILSNFGNLTEAEQKQLAYDYAIYCYMCMFGLMSGDPAYTALSDHYTDKEFTRLDTACNVLKTDYMFKRIASIIEALQTENSEIIMRISYTQLSSGNIIGDIYNEYTDNYNDFYKAIGAIYEQ